MVADAVASVAAAAAVVQKGSSKALVAAYDGRLWAQGLRNGGLCCWGVQHCVTGQWEELR